tara:strand:+ start:477 stop:923 length:447 start_codon:yes stop_codon:yes gene_type:complete
MIISLKTYIEKTYRSFENIKLNLIELYNQLSRCSDISDNTLKDIINNNTIFVYVNEKDYIVGAITILIEQKIIHNGGKVCHIEDLVVDSSVRSYGIGKKLIKFCKQVAIENVCYKIILNCNEFNKSYYEKFGFDSKNIEMSYYYKSLT